MKRVIWILWILLALSVGSGIYFFFGLYQPLLNNYLQSVAFQEIQQQRIHALESAFNDKVLELSLTKQEKESEINQIKTTKDSLIAEMQEEIKDNQIQITQLADKLTVSIVDKILFSSGETKISPDGLEILRRVGNILKNKTDKIIRVEGHTDNVPITGRLQQSFDSNWELSTTRATNVVRLLQEIGIDPARLEAVGLGEYRPIASNETPEERAQNRRIEIILLPIRE
jgi:chemotaxis protein MotB